MSEVEKVPLQEADPALIEEVFSKEADKLTEEDIDLIIAEFRSDRLAFLQAAEAAPKATKRTAGAATKAKEAAANLTIDDLFSDL